MLLNYVVRDDKYNNINQILKNEFQISARLLHKLIINKHVFCNDKMVDTRNNISIDDVITVDLDFEEDNSNIVASNIKLNILYEDDAFLILNKPAGITVHPSILHYDNSLSNGIKYYFDTIGLKRKIRPINRLDKNTSGIIIFAKNEYVQECLIKQMSNNSFKKEYIAIVEGKFENQQGIINLPISRKENSIIERCISENGQEAITEYKVLKEYNNISVVRCYLKTGRTHQIRVHMSAIKHPIIGDTMYGKSSDLIDRQSLHSYKVSFIHPISHKNLELVCDIPDDMKKLEK